MSVRAWLYLNDEKRWHFGVDTERDTYFRCLKNVTIKSSLRIMQYLGTTFLSWSHSVACVNISEIKITFCVIFGFFGQIFGFLPYFWIFPKLAGKVDWQIFCCITSGLLVDNHLFCYLKLTTS